MTLIDALPVALDPKSAFEAAFSGELPETLGLKDQDLIAIAKMAERALGDGDTALAFRAYALLVLLDPQNVPYQIGLAESALAARTPSAALQAASAVVASTPDNPQGYYWSARACLELGLIAEAKEDLEDAASFAKQARMGTLFAECQALLGKLQ
ncbi:MAG: hypothetical protein AAGF45_11075 [Pseudomonadota bacterium]